MQIGSLFSGYGGLDMAVSAALDGDVAWHCEVDVAASRVLAHHWPHVPNLGDITTVRWRKVARVDVLTGGFPCQDLSLAGSRAGITGGTRSSLWIHMAKAIRKLRPALVVVENVKGIYSAAAAVRAMGPLEVGLDPDRGPTAIEAVCADLAELGYDARWICVPASEAGAPHKRERVFIAAIEVAAHPRGVELLRRGARVDVARPAGASRPEGPDRVAEPGGGPATDGGGLGFGPYRGAVDRWSAVLGREAPEPLEHRDGFADRVRPAFVEWMMGLPAGHVTDVPDLTRRQQLRLLGNGVVPQQASLALSILLDDAAWT
jgi:DNA (cytosine-5)-methyltransferase 1